VKLLALAFAVTVWAAPIAAQSSSGIQSPRAPIDSVVRRPAPLNFFFRSLLIPGWGQAALDRKLTGGLFVMFEGLSWSMMLKAISEPMSRRTCWIFRPIFMPGCSPVAVPASASPSRSATNELGRDRHF